jgi:glycosyltransferase involved in cell wall biosynthesis
LKMSVAVLVPTWKRPDKLELCLQSLLKQSRAPNKIIVVYREVDAEGKKVVDRYTQSLSDFSKFIALKVDIPGVIAAENAGLKEIDEDIVAFLDDDAEAPRDWVSKLVGHFESNPKIVGVGGPDFITGDKDPHYPYKREVVGKFTYYGKVIGNHHQNVLSSQNVDVLKGVNMAFLTKGLPLLDNELASEHNVGNGSQWELDICLAMRKKGILFFDHTMVVRHNSNHDHFIELLNQRNNAHNLTYVILKHGSFLSNMAFVFYSSFIGNTQNIGFLKFLQLLKNEGLGRAIKLYYFSIWGFLLGLKTFTLKALNRQ